MMPRRLAWLPSLVVVLGTGVAAATLRLFAPVAPLPIYGVVPPFSLVDQRERSFTQQELTGRVWIGDFIFTSCAGQCPLMSDQLRSVQRALAGERELRFVSFSVDPQRDTPEVLAAYAQQYGADARWYLATGSRAALTRLCKDGFHLAFDDDPHSPREPILHSVRFVLVDRAGRIRGYYDATDARKLAQLREDIRRLLKERG